MIKKQELVDQVKHLQTENCRLADEAASLQLRLEAALATEQLLRLQVEQLKNMNYQLAHPKTHLV